MQFYAAALLSGAAFVAAQGVTSAISPTAPAPAGCTGSVDGDFQITIYQAQQKRDIEVRQDSGACSGEGALVISLKDGVLTDNKQRTGYIADNYQFQFDGPAQTGAIYTAGWSVCSNSFLALGSNTTFYRCLSGSFYNLYNVNWAEQCEAISIGAVPCDGSSLVKPSGASSVSSASSASSASAPAASGSSASAPAASASAPASQIADGQPQAPSVAPAPAPSLMVSQITDGQIQLPTGAPPTAPSAIVSQITDGQIQAPTAPAATAPAATAPAAVVSQIGDGQIQAPTVSAAPMPSSPAAANGTYSGSPPIATGAASTVGASFAAVVLGFAAVALL